MSAGAFQPFHAPTGPHAGGHVPRCPTMWVTPGAARSWRFSPALAGTILCLLCASQAAQAQSVPTSTRPTQRELSASSNAASLATGPIVGDDASATGDPGSPPDYSAHARVKPPPATSFALEEAETEALESGMGPAFSTVEAMPGVVPVFSGVPYLIVRGASPAGSLSF